MYQVISLRNALARRLLIAASIVGTAAMGCGDSGTGGSGGTPAGGSNTGGNNTGGTNNGGNNTGGDATGGGGSTSVIPCIDVTAGDCGAPDAQACECEGCADTCGASDCVCPSCAGDAFCSNPANCQDDGECDPYNEGCVCADCADHPNCEAPEDCGNTTDDNGNGLIDCLDINWCANDVTCVAPACEDTTAILVGDTTGDTTAGTALINGGCGQAGAKEKVYTYTPAANGFVQITLVPTDAADDFLIRVRSDCADLATQTACADVGIEGENEVTVANSVAGTPIVIIVDGYNTDTEGAFTLTLVETADGGCLVDDTCSAAQGEACTCADCTMSGVCGFCDADQAACDPAEACTCNSCDADPYCMDPTNCTDDGFCNQLFEGCVCADCTAVPNCAG